jgi:hypothetical protein
VAVGSGDVLKSFLVTYPKQQQREQVGETISKDIKKAKVQEYKKLIEGDVMAQATWRSRRQEGASE